MNLSCFFILDTLYFIYSWKMVISFSRVVMPVYLYFFFLLN